MTTPASIAAAVAPVVVEKLTPQFNKINADLAKCVTEEQVKALIVNNNRALSETINTAVTLGNADLTIQMESLRTQFSALEATVQKAKKPAASKAADATSATGDETGTAPAGAKIMSNKRTYFIMLFNTDEEYRKSVMDVETEAKLEEQAPIKAKTGDKKINAKAAAMWNIKKDDATFSADIKSRMDAYNAAIKPAATTA